MHLVVEKSTESTCWRRVFELRAIEAHDLEPIPLFTKYSAIQTTDTRGASITIKSSLTHSNEQLSLLASLASLALLTPLPSITRTRHSLTHSPTISTL